MGMNPETNRLEMLTPEEIEKEAAMDKEAKRILDQFPRLLRPNGEPVPKHWSVFTVGEDVVVKNYTFRVVYMNEGSLMLEPVGPLLVGDGTEEPVKPGNL